MKKPDPELPYRFAEAVIEELATIRCELAAHRKLLIELLSISTKVRRRKIKNRLYVNRLTGPMKLARELKKQIGLMEED